jgi:hypothetical protein
MAMEVMIRRAASAAARGQGRKSRIWEKVVSHSPRENEVADDRGKSEGHRYCPFYKHGISDVSPLSKSEVQCIPLLR